MPPKFPQQFGPYTLHDLIARGGMAEIYRATMPGIGGFEKTVAIKKILPHLAENEEFITMLIDEARIIVSLNHANIAQVYDLGVLDETYYIAMEYVHSVDLAAVMKLVEKNNSTVPVAHAVFIAGCVCAGLHAAHSKNDDDGRPLHIVHRDVSPHNVLISYAGDVKIIDFGVAKARNKETHTKMGVIKGKLLYMAPEQAMAKEIDGRADLFSAGLILYRMLTGILPFEGDNEFQIYNNILSKEITPPRVLNENVTEELNQIVMQLLHRDADHRYQDGYTAKADLDRALHSISPGYSINRLSRFIEDNFSGQDEGSGPREIPNPRTPSFNSVDTGAGARNPFGARDSSQPMPAPAASFGSQSAASVAHTAETVERGKMAFPTPPPLDLGSEPETVEAAPRNGLGGPPPPPSSSFSSGQFTARPSAEPMKTESRSSESTTNFDVAPTGAHPSGSRLPIVPILGIALMLTFLAVLGVNKWINDNAVEASETIERPKEPVASERPDEAGVVAVEPDEFAQEPEEVDEEPVQEDVVEEPLLDATVDLTISSNPEGAMVKVDGQEFGQTPAILNVPRSENALKIEVSADGYVSQEVEVVPSETVEKTVTLDKVKEKPKPKPRPRPRKRPKKRKKPEKEEPVSFDIDLLGGDEPEKKEKEEILNPFGQ